MTAPYPPKIIRLPLGKSTEGQSYLATFISGPAVILFFTGPRISMC